MTPAKFFGTSYFKVLIFKAEEDYGKASAALSTFLRSLDP